MVAHLERKTGRGAETHRRRDRLAVVDRVRAIAAAIATLVAAAAPAAAPPAVAGAKASTKPYAVGTHSFTFVDASRPTSPNGSYPGVPSRTLPTLLMYPAKGDPTVAPVEDAPPLRRPRHHGFPVVVFAHGFNGTPAGYAPFLAQLVRRGYVVAAPAFPLTVAGGPGGLRFSDYESQPGDVSFVLTRLGLVATDTGSRTPSTRTMPPLPATPSARSRRLAWRLTAAAWTRVPMQRWPSPEASFRFTAAPTSPSPRRR
jgi:hypothetical protein